jgi:amino acid adenylation domain-containing protein
MLRATFAATLNGPQQSIKPIATIPVDRLDLRGANAPAALDDAFVRPFHLTEPVLRVRGWRTAEVDGLSLAANPLACDARSLAIIAHELDAFTAPRGRGAPWLPAPVGTYSDHVLAQRAPAGMALANSQLAYWSEKLSAVEPVELPTDRARSSSKTSAVGVIPLRTSRRLTQAVRSFAHERRTSVFTVITAAVVALLSRYSDLSDIALAVPRHVRPPELEGVVGQFLNPLVLRLEVSDPVDFAALVSATQAELSRASADQHLPAGGLAVALAPGLLPLAQAATTGAAVGSLPRSRCADTVENAVFRSWDPRAETSADIAVMLMDRAEVIAGTVAFKCALFDRAAIEQLRRHLVNLFERGVADATCPVSQIPLLSASEHSRIVYDWNATTVTYDSSVTVPELVCAQVRRTPRAVAAVDARSALSYWELDQLSNQVARYLRGVGVLAETTVGVALERSTTVSVVLLGILKAGGAYLPLDPAQPLKRLSEIVRAAGANHVVTDDSRLAADLQSKVAVLLKRDQASIQKESTDPVAPPTRPDGLGYVLFTSGSTGVPKGVEIPHAAISDLLLGAREYLDLSEGQSMLQLSPLTFDASTLELWGPLVHGGTVVFGEVGPLFTRFRDCVRRYNVTTVLLISPQLDILVERGVEQLDGITQLLVGGDVVTPRTFGRVHDHFAGRMRLISCYGPTEATLICSYYAADDLLSQFTSVPIGRPTPAAELYVLDRALEPVPPRVIGEIYVGGAGLARGYVADAEETRERFVASPFGPSGARLYRSGDRGSFRRDGLLEFHGRVDDQVKIRGYRVELGEVEAALEAYRGVRRAVVVPTEQFEGRSWSLRAYVLLRPNTRSGEVNEFLRSRLPDYMLPSEIIEVESIPLTAHGKVDREALRRVPQAR